MITALYTCKGYFPTGSGVIHLADFALNRCWLASRHSPEFLLSLFINATPLSMSMHSQ